jgi:lambda repressor-like predicted transcriptional regulator
MVSDAGMKEIKAKQWRDALQTLGLMPNSSVVTFLLQQQGWTQQKIADTLGYSRGGVSYAIQTASSQEICEWVCDQLDAPYEVLWPGRAASRDRRAK